MVFPVTRMRRYRKNSKIRDIVRETKLDKEDLIYPIFFKEELQGDEKEPIESMPGEYRYSLNAGIEFAKQLEEKGLKSIIVFGVPLPESKDEVASPDYSSTGIVQRAIRELKKQTDLVVIGDVCLCQYTSHGHCGLIKENDDTDDGVEILNDESLEYLAKVAVSYAKAGVDIVAPSDMMDGRVDAIRTALDENGFYNVMIMSYSAKYASAFYEPFRAAADSSPTHGNRKSYQMDFHNRKEGLKEALLDVEEGADIIMVKPAMSYLDIVREVADRVDLPVAAYSVSGEYAMVKAAAKLGYIDEERIICEMAVSTYRAGADIYLTYFAKELARFMEEGRIG